MPPLRSPSAATDTTTATAEIKGWCRGGFRLGASAVRWLSEYPPKIKRAKRHDDDARFQTERPARTRSGSVESGRGM